MQSKVDDLMRLADEYANYSRYAHTPNLPDNSRAALRAALEAALKECRNTTLEEAAVPITEFPQSFRDDLAEAIRQGKVTIS